MITAPIIGISRHRILRDGKGITTLVGLMGCNLSCAYCINQGLLRKSNANFSLMTTKEVLDKVKVDDIYFRATNGGIVFGGGEPLLHSEFIVEFRKICPTDWRIIIETSLNVSEDAILMVLYVVDELIVDIKDSDSLIYHRYTGGTNENVKSNLELLAHQGLNSKVSVRIPLIPEYNTWTNVRHSIAELKSLGYHDISVLKYIKHTDANGHKINSNDLTGKQKCRLLKYVRKVVSESNGLFFNDTICHTQQCAGTCPKCEKELKDLSIQLQKLHTYII